MKIDSGISVWRSPAVWGNLATLLVLGLIVAALASLQSDAWWQAMPRASHWWIAGVAVLAYVLFCAAILWRSRPGRSGDEPGVASTQSFVLVAYASQTGFARELAERTADNLRGAGLAVKLRGMEQVDAALLAQADRALFVASTTGEGDPPDPALAFVRGVMSQSFALDHMQYAVLALGDREYTNFCGFGHELDNWLRQHGARPLFDMVEIDNAEESALRHWQHHIGQISGVTDQPDWTTPHYESWTLIKRTLLNPGSTGGGVFHLSIAAPAETPRQWVAGDIAEIGPCQSPQAVRALLDATGLDHASHVDIKGGLQALGDVLSRSHLPTPGEVDGLGAQALAETLKPLPHREYSIASLPADGTLELAVRRMLRPDGSPGIGSGWLCDHAIPGGEIALRLRSNSNFHAPEAHRPMILIGNGTGIAGLRAHLKARVAANAPRNWLLFGERNAERDFFFGNELLGWQAQGFIERLDLAFSRDQEQRIYVQHALQQAAGTLRQWVADGAAIYVCGSLAGMAPAVDVVLRFALGDATIEDMLANGRYRRDVY
jgi:sulfite reductase (NADPH) flavoprotein alpha-component